MKKVVLTALSVLLIFTLVACGNKVEDANSDKYISKATEIVSLLNEAKYAEVHTMFDETMKASLPLDQMGQLTPVIEQSGSFNTIDKSSIAEQDGYYVVVLIAKYSKENRVYTISFNDKDEIAGLFIQ